MHTVDVKDHVLNLMCQYIYFLLRNEGVYLWEQSVTEMQTDRQTLKKNKTNQFNKELSTFHSSSCGLLRDNLVGFRPNDWARDLIALYIIILTFTLYAIFMSEAHFQACLDFFFN